VEQIASRVADCEAAFTDDCRGCPREQRRGQSRLCPSLYSPACFASTSDATLTWPVFSLVHSFVISRFSARSSCSQQLAAVLDSLRTDRDRLGPRQIQVGIISWLTDVRIALETLGGD
jgi:hypothetical protein